MADFEIITGGAITALLKTLIRRKTPLKLNLIDTRYENLTRIRSITDHKKTPHMVIDIPEGFEKAAAGSDVWQMRFTFSGPDRIKYVFSTIGGEFVGKSICLKAPQEIERRQRRELFRIDAPQGTRIQFSKGGNRLELEVMNLSLGGSLAAWVQTRTDMPDNLLFAVAQRIEDVALVFPAEIAPQPIHIEALEIKRVEQKSQLHRYELGLEFCEVSPSEKRRLTDLIYELQRQNLRHRLPLDL